MKKYWKPLAVLAALAVLITGAALLYGALKEKYLPNSFSDPPTASRAESPEAASDYAAPDFTVLDENGKEVKLSDYFGKPIVLNFWASWCYYCKEEMPDFNSAYHDNPDIHFLMVNITDGNQETLSSAKEFLDRSEYDFPVFFDTELEAAGAYGVMGLPMTMFINKDGELVTYASGMLTSEGLDRGLELIREQNVT